MADAPILPKNGAPITWDKVPESLKNEFFNNITNSAYIQALIDRYNVIGIDLEGLRFQHKVETSIAETAHTTHETVEHHENHNNHLPHGHGHEGHGFTPDTLTQQITDTKEYQDTLKPLQDARAENWEKKKAKVITKWEQQHGLSINSTEGQAYLNRRADNPNSHAVKKLAEKEFRKRHSDIARKADTDVSAGSYANDEIGKQYKAAAMQNAHRELETRYGKQLRAGKISHDAFRAKANEIYTKRDKDFAKLFIRDHKEKAQQYIKNGTDPVLNHAWQETKQGKREIKQRAKVTTAVNQFNKNKMAVTPETLGSEHFKKQISEKFKEKQNEDQKNFKLSKNDLDRLSKALKEQQQSFQQESFEQPETFGEEPMPGEGNLPEMPTEAFGEEAVAEEAMAGEAAAGESAVAATAAGEGTAAAGAAAAAGGAGAAAGTTAAAGAGVAAAAGGGAAAAATFPVWGIVALVLLGIVLLVIIVLIIVNLVTNASSSTTATPPVPGLTIQVTANQTVTTPNTINATITVTCNATCKTQGTIILYEPTPFPNGISINPDPQKTTPKYSTTQYPISWQLSDFKPTTGSDGTDTYIFLLSLNTNTQASKTKFGLSFNGSVLGGGSSGTGTGTGAAPNSNECSGTYNFSDPNKPGYNANPLKNFGDPTCSWNGNNDQLSKIVNSFTSNQDWQKCYFLILAPHESSDNPNAYLKSSTSGLGAYGFFQMNPSSAGRQSTYDVGSVEWDGKGSNYTESQMYYAFKHNALTGNDFSYWGSWNNQYTTLHYDTKHWCHP